MPALDSTFKEILRIFRLKAGSDVHFVIIMRPPSLDILGGRLWEVRLQFVNS